MTEKTSLMVMERAAEMLAEATTIQKAKELKDLALTTADWAKRRGLGEQAVQHARLYALLAERRMGEMLAATKPKRAKGGQPYQKKSTSAQRELVEPSLAELGLTKKESSRAQFLADLSEEKFEAVRDGKKTRTQVRREVRRDETTRKAAPLPTSKYRVLYADPPWRYGDTRDGLSTATGASTHYPTMSISELCALPIADLAGDDAVLFLWVTSPILPEAFSVIKAWGFTYKASFIWDKVRHNLGHYNSVRHEYLLVCTRGSCLPDSNKLIDSVQTIERSKEHSEKPEGFRKIIETMYVTGKKLELFAREKRNDTEWEYWGNEI